MPGRHAVHFRVVVGVLVARLPDPVLAPVGQGLDVFGHPLAIARRPDAHPAAFNRLAVDVQDAVRNLNRVAGQANDALDVVGRVVLRQLENHDVATLGLARQDAVLDQRQAPRQGVAAVAV